MHNGGGRGPRCPRNYVFAGVCVYADLVARAVSLCPAHRVRGCLSCVLCVLCVLELPPPDTSSSLDKSRSFHLVGKALPSSSPQKGGTGLGSSSFTSLTPLTGGGGECGMKKRSHVTWGHGRSESMYDLDEPHLLFGGGYHQPVHLFDA